MDEGEADKLGAELAKLREALADREAFWREHWRHNQRREIVAEEDEVRPLRDKIQVIEARIARLKRGSPWR